MAKKPTPEIGLVRCPICSKQHKPEELEQGKGFSYTCPRCRAERVIPEPRTAVDREAAERPTRRKAAAKKRRSSR